MTQKQASKTIESLISYWQAHRQFDANITGLAKYVRVSRDTVYRWLNRRSNPKQQKANLIQEWLEQRNNQE